MNYLFTKTPLLFFVQNLWRDEAFTYLMSQQSIGDILRTTAADFNPPLYYLFMHAWMLMFGSSEIAMRTVSLLFYVLTIYIMFEIMAVVFQISFKRALIYFLLIILNPMLLTFAFEARMYMMAAFFVTLSYFALLTKRKKLYIAAMTLALYTHYFTVLILAAQIISSIVDSVCRTRGLAHVTSTWKDKAVFLIPLILFIPWLLFLISYHDLSIAEFWIATPKAQDIMYLPFVLFTGYQRVFGEYYHDHAGYISFHTNLNILLWAILILPFIPGIFKKQHIANPNLPKNYVQLTMWFLLPPVFLYIISLFAIPVYHPRYFMFSVVGLLLYMIFVLDSILLAQSQALIPIVAHFANISAQNELTSVYTRSILKCEGYIKYVSSIFRVRRLFNIHTVLSFIKKHLIMLTAVLLLLFATLYYNKLNLRYNAKRASSTMFQEIDQSMKNDDRVYLTHELDYFLARYYMKNNKIYIFNMPYEDIPFYIGKVLIPPSAFASGIPLYPVRVFIVYYDQYVVRSEM